MKVMSPLLPRHYSVIDDNSSIADYGPSNSGSMFTTLVVNWNIVFQTHRQSLLLIEWASMDSRHAKSLDIENIAASRQ